MDSPLGEDPASGRRALLGAAAEVLSEHGLDAPLELIAERAGVGRDTLSRDFPDRVDLAVAVLAQEVDDLADRTRSWAGEADVFLWFLDALADLCVRNAAVLEALRSAAPQALAPLRRTLVEAGGRALRDAQMAGLVRADLKAGDILAIATLLGAGLSGDLAERQTVSLRTREIILGGLKARG
jgi:AcrR family transcriptional regulator